MPRFRELIEREPELARKSRLKPLLRVLVSLVFLAVVYAAVDLQSLLQTLSSITLAGAVLLMALYALGQLISALKWRIFVQTAGISRSIMQTVRAYFFGMFVNTFGLGTLGGDVARSLVLQPEKGRRAATLATVVADRVHGLATLLSMGAAAILIVRPPVLGTTVVLITGLSALVLVAFWWAGPRVLTMIFPPGHKFNQAALMAANAFPREPRPFFSATLISVIFHTIQISMHALIARELGADLSWGILFAMVPLINIAASLPISVNGIGLREAMYVLLFVPLGVSREIAVAFGAVWIVSVTLVSALGGFLLTPELQSIPSENSQTSSAAQAEEDKETQRASA